MTIQVLCNSDFIFDNHYNHNIIASANILNIMVDKVTFNSSGSPVTAVSKPEKSIQI